MQVCIFTIRMDVSDYVFQCLNAENQRDFVFDQSSQLTFTSTILRACVNVTIIDDNDVEGDHQFEVVITTTTLGTILITSSVTTITINDNTGNMMPYVNRFLTHGLLICFRWEPVSSISTANL